MMDQALPDSIRELYQRANPCRLCPRECGVLRKAGDIGFCQAPYNVQIARYLPHHGEEPPISGMHGSGTIFFSHCHLKCPYCQNYQISLHGQGYDITLSELVDIFLDLQESGCHNVNIVSGTHFLHRITHAIWEAKKVGFSIPVVYNSSGYEHPDVVTLLEEWIDVYLPDFKYGNSDAGKRFSGVTDYTEIAIEALQRMVKQKGETLLNNEGLLQRGVVVRHLVLPNVISDTRQVLRLISEVITDGVYVSLMGQYFPTPLVVHNDLLNRRITDLEWQDALKWARIFDIEKGWFQEPQDEKSDLFIPNFQDENVFSFETPIHQNGRALNFDFVKGT